MKNNFLKFNKQQKSWIYLLEGRQESPFAPRSHNQRKVPGMAGAHITSTEIDMLQVKQPVGFVVDDEAHEQQLLDELKTWLLTDEEVEIE